MVGTHRRWGWVSSSLTTNGGGGARVAGQDWGYSCCQDRLGLELVAHVVVRLSKMGMGVVGVGVEGCWEWCRRHREAGARLGVDGRRVLDGWLGVVTASSPSSLTAGGGRCVVIIASGWR